MPQGQDEFYFALPYNKMDLALWSLNNNIPASELAELLECSEAQAQFVYNDILSKRKTTKYQHSRPLLIESVDEVS